MKKLDEEEKGKLVKVKIINLFPQGKYFHLEFYLLSLQRIWAQLENCWHKQSDQIL